MNELPKVDFTNKPWGTQLRMGLFGAAGFVFGAGVAVTALIWMALLLQWILHVAIMPMGGAWIFIPIVAGLTFAKVGAGLGELMTWPLLLEWFWGRTVLFRFVLVTPLFWILCVGAYILVFEPDGYLSDSDNVMKVMLFPPSILVAGYFCYAKLIKSPKK